MAGRRLRVDLDELEDVVAILVMGAGFAALWAGVDRWWLVFAIGWLVVVPLVDHLTDVVETTEVEPADESADDGDPALDELRERYASGEIPEAEFERRVERLLETESPEMARERSRERREGTTREREPGRTG